MIFKYKATTEGGIRQEGTISAASEDLAIGALQKKGLIILEIREEGKKSILELSFFERVKPKEIVILSRQLSTLFEAKVPILSSFQLLAQESENKLLKRVLNTVVDDIRGGFPISKALERHPNVFSNFYVNMVLSGEESGKLSETFSYMANYLERQYELVSKAKHAMVYPAFIIMAFIGVMVLMFVVVIPKLSEIILATEQEVPIYTKIVIATSNFFVNYGVLVLLFFVLGGIFFWRYSLTEKGKISLESMRLSIPYFGDLYRKLYLSRIADNLDTMLSSGISMLKAIEVTGKVVNSYAYKNILDQAADFVRGGGSLSQALSEHKEIPPIMTQMIRIGEETGKLGFVLGTVSRFYRREVETAIETLVSLIEPLMIVVLGIGVGVLLTAVLMPIYNVASSF
jgi:type IV pilus assembly protein PilC